LKLRQEISETIAAHKEKEAQILEVENQMVDIKKFVQQMVGNFQDSEFSLSVSSPMQYHEDVPFNENNVTQYLSELEEYVSSFITFLASRSKQPYPSIQALPLDTMGVKDFSKGQVQIDTTMPTEYAHIVEDADTEDELVTNSKDLRMKFMAVAAKDFGNIN
jgi:paraquat-inducible protein B